MTPDLERAPNYVRHHIYQQSLHTSPLPLMRFMWIPGFLYLSVSLLSYKFYANLHPHLPYCCFTSGIKPIKYGYLNIHVFIYIYIYIFQSQLSRGRWEIGQNSKIQTCSRSKLLMHRGPLSYGPIAPLFET